MNDNFLNIFKRFKLNDVVSSTNKTLSVIKKAIPVYKELTPYVKKEKTIFKKNNKENIIKESNFSSNIDNDNYNDTLTFFH